MSHFVHQSPTPLHHTWLSLSSGCPVNSPRDVTEAQMVVASVETDRQTDRWFAVEWRRTIHPLITAVDSYQARDYWSEAAVCAMHKRVADQTPIHRVVPIALRTTEVYVTVRWLHRPQMFWCLEDPVVPVVVASLEMPSESAPSHDGSSCICALQTILCCPDSSSFSNEVIKRNSVKLCHMLGGGQD